MTAAFEIEKYMEELAGFISVYLKGLLSVLSNARMNRSPVGADARAFFCLFERTRSYAKVSIDYNLPIIDPPLGVCLALAHVSYDA